MERECDVKDWFQLLPLELQLHILSYVKVEDLARNCAFVCKYWFDLTKNVSLWKELEISVDEEVHEDIEPFCRVLERCPALVKLAIHATEPTKPYVQRFAVFPGLKILTLDCCFDLEAEDFCTIVSSCPLIESLTLESCTDTDVACFEHIACLSKMKHLSITNSISIDDACIDVISSKPSSLESFEMSECENISVASVQRFIEQRRQQLRSLVIDDVNLTDECMIAVSECSQLEHFSAFIRNAITDNGLKALCKVCTLRSLCLYLRKDYISKFAIALFFSRTQFLEQLSLRSEVIDDEVLELSSKSLHSVKHLYFAICDKITDAGIQRILHNCKNLLSLRFLATPGLRGQFLKDIPVELPQLKSLTLDLFDNSNIDSSCISYFSQRMPHCVLHN